MKLRYLVVAVAVLSVACVKTPEEPQDPDVVTLSVETRNIQAWSDSVTDTVRFNCNGKWTAETDETWISVSAKGYGSQKEQEFVFSMTRNTTDSDRTGIITLYTRDGYETILVTQFSIARRSVSNHFRKIMETGYDHVYICAHRANTYEGTYVTKDCPENSVPAVERAIEKGLDMVEIDVRQTKDGVLVCSHDDNISNVTNGSGKVSANTYATIAGYDMKIRANGTVVKGVHIAKLSEVLEAAKDKIWVNLDLDKTALQTSVVLRVVEEAGMLDQVTFFTGGDSALALDYYNTSKKRVSPHLSVTSAGTASNLSGLRTFPLMQLNYQYYNGDKGTTSLSSGLRNSGWCTFSNLLSYDEAVMKGNTEALDLFTAAKIDYLQTDIGDNDNIQNYLKNRDLR